MIPCRVVIIGKRGQCIMRDILLHAIPPVGSYVCEPPDALGLKVHSVMSSTERVTLQVREEVEGDILFDELKTVGWKEFR